MPPFMKKALKVVAAVLLLLVILGGAFYTWASVASGNLLDRSFASHDEAFPIPFPLAGEEIEERGLTPEEAEAEAVALAMERGQHLLESRYACSDCHGENFGGGVMIDAFPIGTLLGPNITTGMGSRTVEYTSTDWDRIVRHGVLPDGRPAAMPSIDFQSMSDQELSDIVTYIQNQPPVEGDTQRPVLGPLGKVLIATGQIPLSADVLAERTDHVALPPATEVSLDFGAHLATPCVGCHGPALSGGPIPGGDPAWVAARNLTPAEDGMAGWTFADFEAAMRDGARPDGTSLQLPMTLVLPYTSKLTDVEMEALWMYLSSLDPLPTGAM
jgi:mono/diheme cytochrome c family protein